jgi:two-component sensor histidine kinase
LVAELDHRVKNALATVSAIISHTRQGSRSLANFAVALEGRIRSMATTHELLSSGRWQGISLTELVRRELGPYAGRTNTEIAGPEVVLRPEAGQAMAMVLHELVTNAAKYGALSTRHGRIAIKWNQQLNGETRPPLVLKWQEMGGPPVVATGKPSYGISTIRELIPYEFGGMVDLVLAPDGVRCRLELPASWFNNDPACVSLAFPTVPEVSRENIESALRAIDTRIMEGERRLDRHGKLMERLLVQGRKIDLTMPEELQLNLMTGLCLLRKQRAMLLKELEHYRSLRAP